jgi:DNA-binding winged helix-turn-helix (wHTH) protein
LPGDDVHRLATVIEGRQASLAHALPVERPVGLSSTEKRFYCIATGTREHRVGSSAEAMFGGLTPTRYMLRSGDGIRVKPSSVLIVSPAGQRSGEAAYLDWEAQMTKDEQARIVRRCATELLAARQAIDRTLAFLNLLGADSQSDELSGAAELAHAPDRLPAPPPSDRAPAQGGRAPSTPFLLSFDEPNSSYLLGSRQIHLTDLERSILDLLWAAAPAPLSRDLIVEKLNARPGSVEVCVSKIRHKLILMSDGSGHIESIRGRGWKLRTALCVFPPRFREEDRSTQQDSARDGGRDATTGPARRGVPVGGRA